MNYLLAEKLSKSYGEKILFSDITFGLEKGQKTALIAKNGEGKTTLLRILAGLEQADSGQVVIRNGIKISYLPQTPYFEAGLTIFEAAMDLQNETSAAIKEYEDCLKLIKHNNTETLKKHLENATMMMDHLNAWDHENKIKETLSRLNLTDLEKKADTLSGGEQKKLALAKALLCNADILLMDEPTNHLDIDMIEWMENELSRPEITLILVTHDRFFLDNVSNDIMEMENSVIHRYFGNYLYFLEKRTERLAIADKEREKAKALFKKELEWARRQPKARTTKSKARLDAFDEIKEKTSNNISAPNSHFSTASTRLGNKIMEINNLTKRFDDNIIIDDFSYTFKKGERIGLVGKNGAGKSTFLNLITGGIKSDSGKISKGQTVVFGYYSQAGWQPETDKRVIDLIKDIAENVIVGKNSMAAENFLYRFGINYNMQSTFFSRLSGGEKRKIYLLSVLMQNPNFLILDEPTNDLDIFTLSALEEYLISFDGCLLIVSHDRCFLENLTEHLFVFEGNGKIRDYYGYISDYRKHILAGTSKTEKKPKEKLQQKTLKTNNNKLTYKEKIEFESIELQLNDFENEKENILSQMNSGDTTSEALQGLSIRYEEIVTLTNTLSDRWLELSEKLG